MKLFILGYSGSSRCPLILLVGHSAQHIVCLQKCWNDYLIKKWDLSICCILGIVLDSHIHFLILSSQELCEVDMIIALLQVRRWRPRRLSHGAGEQQSGILIQKPLC